MSDLVWLRALLSIASDDTLIPELMRLVYINSVIQNMDRQVSCYRTPYRKYVADDDFFTDDEDDDIDPFDIPNYHLGMSTTRFLTIPETDSYRPTRSTKW